MIEALCMLGMCVLGVMLFVIFVVVCIVDAVLHPDEKGVADI